MKYDAIIAESIANCFCTAGLVNRFRPLAWSLVKIRRVFVFIRIPVIQYYRKLYNKNKSEYRCLLHDAKTLTAFIRQRRGPCPIMFANRFVANFGVFFFRPPVYIVFYCRNDIKWNSPDASPGKSHGAIDIRGWRQRVGRRRYRAKIVFHSSGNVRRRRSRGLKLYNYYYVDTSV